MKTHSIKDRCINRYSTPILSLFMTLLVCTSAYAYEFTSYTSEEREPRTCAFNQFQSGFGCSGSYCDNVRLECHNPGISNITNRRWTPQVSEENGGLQFCAWGQFISGVSTSGRYSDNVSLECANAASVTWASCRWTTDLIPWQNGGWVSEENGGQLLFPGGYFGVGMQCTGSNCDNKRFYVCRTQ